MKKLFWCTLFVLATVSLSAGTINQSPDQLSFQEEKCDFGKINKKKTKSVSVEFKFTNLGNTPIVILKTDPSCSCMTTEFSKEPLRPGDNGVITVNIDTANQEGSFNKTVIVKSTATNDLVLLRIVGTIK